MKKEECIRTNASADEMTPFLEIPPSPTSEPESLGMPLVPLPPFDNRISECSDDSLELIYASILKDGDISLGKSRRKGVHGEKKGSSEKPSRRDYQPLSIKTSAPSLPPYEKMTPILKRKAPRFRILKKCKTRFEALGLIRNGPTHPAMMRMTEESEHKMEFPSSLG